MHKFLKMILAPWTVLELGLGYLNVKWEKWNEHTKVERFHQHYGSSPLDIADIWYDLVHDDGTYLQDDVLLESEKNEKGFIKYIMTHLWLWTYPKNAGVFSSRFGLCERNCRGEPLWKWIRRIGALKVKKIKWENVDGSEYLEVFAASVDGVDFHLREERHPTLPRDTKASSHKIKKYAAKYEIALAVHRPKCVHISGPYKGGVSDITIFRIGGLREKFEKMNRVIRGIRRVKLCLADRGYHSKEENDNEIFSLPNTHDSKELNNFNSHGCLCHETFNGRLKFFDVLSAPFRHGFNKHKHVFEAVVVIVQYQMDNGSPIYAV